MIRNDLASVISLDGRWDLLAGREGIKDEVEVPGCWEAQGFPMTWDGPGRYQRTVHIPAAWADQPALLEFDAVSYAATVRCNGVPVGEHLGLWTPFACDVTAAIRPGEENVLEVDVVKPCHQLAGGRFPMRTTLAGFLPDVATTFGGLWQSVRLRLLPAGFEELRVDADPISGAVRVQGRLTLPTSMPHAILRATVFHDKHRLVEYELLAVPDERFRLLLYVQKPLLWHPDNPVLYQVHLEIRDDQQPVAAVTQKFGFRRLECDGERLLLNDRPICLRGVLNWGWNPQSIAPHYTPEQVHTEIRRLRELGFNLIKLCLFIPNPTYYEVADEEGMLLWQEWPMWLPEITDTLRARAPAEYRDYMQLTRHHPSVVIYTLGCELDRRVDDALLAQLNAVVRHEVDNVLFCDNSGSGEAYDGLPLDFADFSDYHTYGELHHLDIMLDHWRRDWQPSRPLLFGEFCDADDCRDRAAIIAANDGSLPWWMTPANPAYVWRSEVRALSEAEERLHAAQIDVSPRQLMEIARAQSFVVRKYTLETVRKRRQVQGYVITGLRDTPIATSGILDDLGTPKWPAQLFSGFNADAVLALDVGRSRVWTHGGDRPERLDCHNWWAGEPVRLHVVLNHTASQEINNGVMRWQVTAANGRQIAAGTETVRHPLSTGAPRELGTIAFIAPASNRSQRLRLRVRFQSDEVACANHWPLWVYPPPSRDHGQIAIYDPVRQLSADLRTIGQSCSAGRLTSQRGMVITSMLDTPLRKFLLNGGHVLLLQPGDGPLPVQRVPFWRESVKVLASHRLWLHFPHCGFVDLQFFGLATDAAFDPAQIRDVLPEIDGYTSILRRLDAREFTVSDYLFEARVGKGLLFGCSLRLQGGAGVQPTGLLRNVAGRYLLKALIEIANCSDDRARE